VSYTASAVNWGEMDNLWAFLGLSVVNLSGIAVTVLGQRRGKDRAVARDEKLTAVDAKMDEVKEQVVNDHGDRNLRIQLDRIERRQQEMATDVRGVKSDVSGVKKDVGRLADAAVDDRETHRTDVARLDREIGDLKRRP